MMVLKNRLLLGTISSIALLAAAGPAFAQETKTPSLEEMWQLVQAQAQQIEKQKKLIDALTASQQKLAGDTEAKLEVAEVEIAEAREQIALTAEAVEQVTQTSPTLLDGSDATGGGAGLKFGGATIGGYGELEYLGGPRDEVDFQRFVLFAGYEFNDRIRFFSELEVEHGVLQDTANGSSNGEVALEQAYVQLDLNENTQLNAGLQLVPLGLINPTHEPNTFYGVERPFVERDIIPSTFSEPGIGISGNVGDTGFSYNFLAHTGLDVDVDGSRPFRIRGGRQNASEAVAKDPAFTAQVKYTAIPGVEFAVGAQYQTDISQGVGDPITSNSVDALLTTAHVSANYNGFGLRALYANWNISGESAESLDRDDINGFYVEPSYKFNTGIDIFGTNAELGFFYRYSERDNLDGRDLLDFGPDRRKRHVLGANFWPHPNVVFKINWADEDRELSESFQTLDLGVGYSF